MTRQERMKRVLFIAFCMAAACNGSPRSQRRVNEDIRTFTIAVQHRSDEPANLCHRATTAAAVASANLSEAISRKEMVPSMRYVELDRADRIMRNACAQFR